METSKPKWVIYILNIIGLHSFRLGGLLSRIATWASSQSIFKMSLDNNQLATPGDIICQSTKTQIGKPYCRRPIVRKSLCNANK